MKLADVIHSTSEFGYVSLSLTKMAGKKVIDVKVSISNEFDNSTLKIEEIMFEDGTSVSVSGEHEIAYIEGSITDDDDDSLEKLAEEIDAVEVAAYKARLGN